MMNLAIATRNAHKAGEIRAGLGARFSYWTLDGFPAAPNTVEDADTFEGNARKKALELARWLAVQPLFAGGGIDLPWFVLADDSGLEVDALEGAPGVRSARFAAADTGHAGNSTDAANNAKLLRLLTQVPRENRTARFRCVIALAAVAPERKPPQAIQGLFPASHEPIQIFQGTCEGRIAFAPAGRGGFGYDPLFIPNGYSSSFAELGEEIKNKISHRAGALARMSEYLNRILEDRSAYRT